MKLVKQNSDESSDASQGPLAAVTALAGAIKPKAKGKAAVKTKALQSVSCSSHSGPPAVGSTTSLSGLRFCVLYQTAWFKGSSENRQMHGGLF